MAPLTRARQSMTIQRSSKEHDGQDAQRSATSDAFLSKKGRSSQPPTTPSRIHQLASGIKTRAAFQRTQSSPDTFSTPYSASSTPFARSRSASIASSVHSVGLSGMRFHHKRPATDCADEDDQDDDDESRYGGCSQSSSYGDRDVSNKENIAPIYRSLSIVDRRQEESIAELESVRQRLPHDGLMQRSELSLPPSQASVPRRSPRARTMWASTSVVTSQDDTASSSEPQTPRKRKRHAEMTLTTNERPNLAEAEGPSTPSNPFASLCLERRSTTTEEDMSVPSSQSTVHSRLFDAATVTSRHDAASDSGYSTPESEMLSDDECMHDDGVEPSDAETTIKRTRVVFDNVYAHARSLLRYGTSSDEALASSTSGAEGVHIIGREAERATLQQFLETRLGVSVNKTSSIITPDKPDAPGCLYLAGMPGTGKTALVRSTLVSLRANAPSVRFAFINCVALSQPRFVFAAILAALGEPSYSMAHIERDPDPIARKAQDDLSALVKGASKSEKILVVLDEVDHLRSRGTRQTVLERVFRLFQRPSGGAATGAATAMIGIANSLALMESLTQLFATSNRTFSCQSLSMSPFSANELQAIVRSRLASLFERYDDPTNTQLIEDSANARPAVISAPALMLAARSIAGPNGDLRRMLDTCRVAIDAVEAEQRRLAIELSTNATFPLPMTGPEASRLLAHLTPTSAPLVGPGQIAEALKPLKGGAMKDIKTVRKLLLHDKLLLLALLVCYERITAGLKVPLPLVGGAGLASTTPREYIRFQQHGVAFDDLYETYVSLLARDGTFDPMEPSDVRVLLDTKLQSAGLVVWREALPLTAKTTLGVAMSAGARLATRRANTVGRSVSLASAVTAEDVLKGLRSVAPACADPKGVTANGSQASAEAMSRIWAAEMDRIEKAKGFKVLAKDMRDVRSEELGGGRMAIADTL